MFRYWPILRQPKATGLAGEERAMRVFLLGLAVQNLHFMEEFATRFEDRFPVLLGLSAWPETFFVGFNLTWMSVWILSAIGLHGGNRMALFAVCFFAIACIVNGAAHPILAVVAHGYFPGLITSPVLGVLGVLLWQKLLQLTRWSVEFS